MKARVYDIANAGPRHRFMTRAGIVSNCGNGIQLHNFKRPAEDLDIKRAIHALKLGVEARSEAEIRRAYDEFLACTVSVDMKKGKPNLDKDGNPIKHAPYVLLGSLMRGCLIPSPGCKFVVGDFAAVEARGLLWLAGDTAGLREFIEIDNDPKAWDLYVRLAASTLGIEPAQVTKAQRNGIGKVGRLACGFGGGSNAVSRMAFGMGMDLDAMGIDPQLVVDGFRNKHSLVVKLWRDYEDAFRTLLKNKRNDRCQVVHAGRCAFTKWADRIEVTLPSGRALTYMNARERASGKKGREGKLELAYDTAVKGAVRTKTIYGGLIAENCTQALCRDALAEVFRQAGAAGWTVAAHVHDEILLDCPYDVVNEAVEWLRSAMSASPSWAPGLPLKCEPEVMLRYGK